MKKKDFVKWLEQFDDDVIIKVNVQREPGLYESYGPVVEEEFNASLHQYDYVDFNGNKFVTSNDRMYREKYLTLGGEV